MTALLLLMSFLTALLSNMQGRGAHHPSLDPVYALACDLGVPIIPPPKPPALIIFPSCAGGAGGPRQYASTDALARYRSDAEYADVWTSKKPSSLAPRPTPCGPSHDAESSTDWSNILIFIARTSPT